jgi:hypothetical protein
VVNLSPRGASIQKGNGKMSSPRSSLDQAHADLVTIEAELNALTAAKSVAIHNAASFAQWKADYNLKQAERERLTALIEALKPEVALIESEEAEAALRKRYAAKVTANAKLAARIKADLAKANGILLALVRDVAEAAAEDSEVNAALPDDLAPLIPAGIIARGRPGLERQELEKTRVWLWVNARNGALIGDQDQVIDRGDGRGRIGEGSYTVNCTSALFEQIEYHPAEPAQRPRDMWQMLLPQPDGPGVAFDGTKLSYPSEVLGALASAERANEPRERPIEIELRPVPAIAAEEVAA